ncbi:hypothetical protein TCAL_10043 [Tigriopus californicus]|uniref:ubiquitinyl hydrolase 1 n=1 Tax=Tigriopus californicus TaxID=6832 RepID=A0A553PQE3_TIGCA|nr:hypothetical protein TCAL_10043 [Tigriopus californicus]
MKRERQVHPHGSGSPAADPVTSISPSLSGMSALQRRDFLEKRAWEWIEAVEDVDRDISEEEKWLDSDDSDDDDEDEDDDEGSDIALERRANSFPAGLLNLGNTCYVNSFLQIWFHNVNFRQALYEWDPEQDDEEGENETLLEAENYKPRGKVASLQALFAMMEAVDPNDFITKLGLDPQVQQDAQEFSKLFISLLESSLSNQKSLNVRSLIQNQFRGEYAYVTKCMACKRESSRPSFFYELDLTLQGNKTLKDCLEDFTKKEKLQGDNQYFCENCNAKKDATRCVRISQVPTVLNLQLNRFIFDMQTGQKKKLNSVVRFPEQLDMSEYLRKPPGSQVYTLTGVLMHVGAEANHGHYIAHIQDACTGQWYKFSDALVGRIWGKNPKLGSESDPFMMNGSSPTNGKRGPKGNNTGKGIQSSNNAYMLVYTEQNALIRIRAKEQEEQIKKTLVQNRALRAIQKKNQVFRRKLREEKRLKREEKWKRLEQYEDAVNRDEDILEDEEDEDDEDEETSSEDLSSPSEDEIDEDLQSGLADYTYVNGLVYPSNFPIYLRAYIEQDRRMLDEEIEESALCKQEQHEERMSIKHNLRDICEQMPYHETEDETGTDFEFIPTEWLMRYLDNPLMAADEPIETLDYLCMHGKLNLEKIFEVKVINVEVANRLCEDVTECRGRRLTHDALCKICVKNQCRRIQLVESTIRDAKAIIELSKKPVTDSGLAYWVGKMSLRNWRKIAKDDLNEDIQEEADNYDDEMDFIEIMEIGLASSKNDKAAPTSPELKDHLPNGTTPTQTQSPKSDDEPLSTKPAPANGSPDNPEEGKAQLDLEEVQTKLLKVGTDISVAKVNGNTPISTNLNAKMGGIEIHPTLANGNSSPVTNGHHRSKSSSTSSTSSTSSKVETHTAVKIKENGHSEPNNRPTSVVTYPLSQLHAERLHFNSDIVCEHGELSPLAANRRLVSSEVWTILKRYFPGTPSFERSHVTCPQCRASANQAARADEERRELAQAQKNALNDVLNERNRPSWSKATLNKVYLISRGFVQEWRSFIRSPSSKDPVRILGNDTLLCEHGGLVYPLDLDTESDYESVIFMVSEDEWGHIRKFFQVDHTISVVRNKEGPELLSSDPKVCAECLAKRKEQEELEKLCYTNVPVYVRRLTGSDKTPVFLDYKDPDFSSSDAITPTGRCATNGTPLNGHPPLKKQKMGESNGIASEAGPHAEENGTTTNNATVNSHHNPLIDVRRSHRRQKVRGEKEFIVSSSMLLRDFKIKIMESFKVAPFDQNLCVNGVYLEDSTKTLGELKVLPKSLIYLRPDEPSTNGPIDMDECWSMQHPEEGFKGTGLLSGM